MRIDLVPRVRMVSRLGCVYYGEQIHVHVVHSLSLISLFKAMQLSISEAGYKAMNKHTMELFKQTMSYIIQYVSESRKNIIFYLYNSTYLVH